MLPYFRLEEPMANLIEYDFAGPERRKQISEAQEIDRAIAVCWAMILVFCGSCLYGLVMFLGWAGQRIAQAWR